MAEVIGWVCLLGSLCVLAWYARWERKQRLWYQRNFNGLLRRVALSDDAILREVAREEMEDGR